MKKILFITGTRADYGKIKSLIKRVDAAKDFEAFIFVSGMHLLEKYGSTYTEVLNDHFANTYVAYSLANTGNMSYDIGDVICQLTGYVNNVKLDMIVVHGDRIDALAGAIVGALNNIRVAHIEGGELSGTIDDSLRHSITKLAHIHLVCNNAARNRLLQMGENDNHIFILGSPDIDIMKSQSLPALDVVKRHYEIPFDNYALLMYHPVTIEIAKLAQNITAIVDAIIKSKKDYIIVYPNNDLGTDIILNAYQRLSSRKHYRIFPSLRFEFFLTLMKHADFVIGNSSAGIRETCVYGIPSIDIGFRQIGRYNSQESLNIQHVVENTTDILHAIDNVDHYRITSSSFGDGNSTERFISILRSEELWRFNIQKNFIDYNTTL